MYWWMCNITPQITLATNCGHPISENNIINHRLIPICSNYDSVSLGPWSWFFKHPWICERHAQPKESKYVCLSILLVSVSLNLDDFPCRNAHNPSAFTLPSNCQPVGRTNWSFQDLCLRQYFLKCLGRYCFRWCHENGFVCLMAPVQSFEKLQLRNVYLQQPSLLENCDMCKRNETGQ